MGQAQSSRSGVIALGVVVQLTYLQWLQMFPEFETTVSQFFWGLLMGMASSLSRNDGGGPVTNAQLQTNLLSLAIAHLAFIFAGTNTQPASQIVGRIASATEGSVSVTTDNGTVTSSSQAFWQQSKYGSMWWQMSLPFRTFRYLPPSRPGCGPLPWTYPNGSSGPF